MQRLMAVCLVLMALSSPATADGDWYSGEFERCSDRGSAADTVDCVYEILDEWDVRLNFAFNGITTSLQGRSREAFRDAQRQWIVYRDANCDWYRSRPGVVIAVEGAVCMLGMTRERVVEMENWLAR